MTVILPPPLRRLSGAERFTGIDATVLDFLVDTYGDLRGNVVPSKLAEWLVRHALGDQRPPGQVFDDFDALTPAGVRVEVKAAAYLQNWPQRTLSRICFSGLKGQAWSDETGRSGEPLDRADVYVFALHTATTHAEYDPLATHLWRFRVVPVDILRAHGSPGAVSLAFLDRVAPSAHRLDELAAAVATHMRPQAA